MGSLGHVPPSSSPNCLIFQVTSEPHKLWHSTLCGFLSSKNTLHCVSKNAAGLKDEKLIKSKPTLKLKHANYSRVFWIFLPNVIKIDPYNFELYRFKVGSFFETQCSVICSAFLGDQLRSYFMVELPGSYMIFCVPVNFILFDSPPRIRSWRRHWWTWLDYCQALSLVSTPLLSTICCYNDNHTITQNIHEKSLPRPHADRNTDIITHLRLDSRIAE